MNILNNESIIENMKRWNVCIKLLLDGPLNAVQMPVNPHEGGASSARLLPQHGKITHIPSPTWSTGDFQHVWYWLWTPARRRAPASLRSWYRRVSMQSWLLLIGRKKMSYLSSTNIESILVCGTVNFKNLKIDWQAGRDNFFFSAV